MGKKLGVIGIVLLLVASSFMLGRSSAPQNAPTAAGKTSNDYPLLAKRLFLENPNEKIINFSPLRSSVRQYFSEKQLGGSMYFEYLPTGTSIRINGDTQFRAASLFKLPVAMELYKSAELGKVDIDKKIQLEPEWLNDEYGTLYQKGAGYELTLRDAAKILLTESDNTALRAILATTETSLETKDRALGSLDIEFTQSPDQSISVGTRSYSSFLKCLYFACYNTQDHSQEILKYLTESKFDTRIVGGISDKAVRVAHKIGVFNEQVQGDCGIVYLDKKNYVLCLMIQGNDTDATNQHFQNISRLVYEYVTSAKK